MLTGLPKTVVITSEETRRALDEPVGQIIDAIKSTLDKTPPELAADIMDRGIVLAGGGALLTGLADRLRDETQMPVQLAESPLTCVAVGSGRSLEEFEVIHRSAKARQRNGRRARNRAGSGSREPGDSLHWSVPCLGNEQHGSRCWTHLSGAVRALPRERDAPLERGSSQPCSCSSRSALITVYFRESSEGPLHAAQRIGVSVLMPFEVAGERVARPFRDGWAWMSDLLDAKDENEKLREENERMRAALIARKTSAQENAVQTGIANYIAGPKFPTDFTARGRADHRPSAVALPAGDHDLGGLRRRHQG